MLSVGSYALKVICRKLSNCVLYLRSICAIFCVLKVVFVQKKADLDQRKQAMG